MRDPKGDLKYMFKDLCCDSAYTFLQLILLMVAKKTS